MVGLKKFRGVRERYPGAWISEIRHPILKRRLWLGTFDSAEEAARAFDEAATLMSGRFAKTNFPITTTETETSDNNNPSANNTATSSLSTTLHTKLRKYSKSLTSGSFTCLRLDAENSQISVWQKRPGTLSESNWLLTVEGNQGMGQKNGLAAEAAESSSAAEAVCDENQGETLAEDERIALEMIEELLFQDE